MRQGQHKQRSRGRGRKVHNPSNRSYDSNGPDVKIRGNAAHIAEKYMNLARDAQVSGDRIASENYLQHAEHYNRIVAASQAHIQQQQMQQQPSSPPAPATNGHDSSSVVEAESTGTDSDPEDVRAEGKENEKGEEEATKPRSSNTRQRRRRTSSNRNVNDAPDKNVAADVEKTPAPKQDAENPSEPSSELDQTAAE